MRRNRALARATDYTLCPPDKTRKASEQYVRTYQSIGPMALNMNEAQFFFTCYTPGLPWFATPLDADVMYNPAIADDIKQEVSQIAMLRDLTILAVLEQTAQNGGIGWYEAQRQLIRSVLVFGSGLQKVNDDQTCQNFRIDQFVTQRDAMGNPVEHVTEECIDPLKLTDSQLEAVGLKRDDLRAKTRKEREQKLYTHINQNEKGEWVTTQEVNGYQLQEERKEPICRYVASATRLAAGDHYGTSPFSQHLAELAAADELGLRLTQIAAIVSNVKWAVNHGSPTDPEHLTFDSGNVIRATVQAGQATDIATVFAQVGNAPAIVEASLARLTKSMAESFGIVGAALPNKDRVTATQVERVSGQLEQLLGGALSSFQATTQPHQIEILKHDLASKLPEIPKGMEKFISTRVLTGTAQAVRQIKSRRMLSAIELASRMPPEAQRSIDYGAILEAVFRYENIWEPGMFKSKQEQQQEAQQAAALQAQMQGAQAGANEAARVAGAVAEQQLAPQQ